MSGQVAICLLDVFGFTAGDGAVMNLVWTIIDAQQAGSGIGGRGGEFEIGQFFWNAPTMPAGKK